MFRSKTEKVLCYAGLLLIGSFLAWRNKDISALYPFLACASLAASMVVVPKADKEQTK